MKYCEDAQDNDSRYFQDVKFRYLEKIENAVNIPRININEMNV